MVVLLPVDERLTAPDAEGLAHVRTTGVDLLVEAVLRSATQHGPTFLAVDPDDHQVVGTCGFLAPARGGRVEIAFWTFPPFEGRGWATAMTRALVTRAFTDPDVHTVVAHTMPERDPAASVLIANGLVRVQSRRRDQTPAGGTGPVRGRVWRWELRRPSRAVTPQGLSPSRT